MYGHTKSIEDHIVVLGWSERTKTLITAMRAQSAELGVESRPLLVITPDTDVGTSGDDRIYFVFGSLTDPEILRHANLEKAHLVFIPQGESGDIEGLIALLGVLAVRPQVRVCVEFAAAEHAAVVRRLAATGQLGSQVEIISGEDISNGLLRYALDTPGTMQLLGELLLPNLAGNMFRRVDLPATWKARSFRVLCEELFARGALVIGYSHGSALIVNPANREQLVQPGDVVWMVATAAVAAACRTEAGTPAT